MDVDDPIGKSGQEPVGYLVHESSQDNVLHLVRLQLFQDRSAIGKGLFRESERRYPQGLHTGMNPGLGVIG